MFTQYQEDATHQDNLEADYNHEAFQSEADAVARSAEIEAELDNDPEYQAWLEERVADLRWPA